MLSIVGLPEISSDSQINMLKLLEIRDEPEALEFRAWLTDLSKFSDKDIRDRLASFNAKLGLAVQTTTGKALRFLFTTAAGVLHPIAGIALGVLDQFAWDRFARRSGVAAFIHELYPSIFG